MINIHSANSRFSILTGISLSCSPTAVIGSSTLRLPIDEITKHVVKREVYYLSHVLEYWLTFVWLLSIWDESLQLNHVIWNAYWNFNLIK